MDDFDDIPVAVRDTPVLKKPAYQRRIFWIAGISAGVVGLLAGAIAATLPMAKIRSAEPVATIVDPPALTEPDASMLSPTEAVATGADSVEATDILGHYPFEEVSRDALVSIAPGIEMAEAAATAYRSMESAARADGVRLVPVSGFRSKEDQKYLFFEVKGERGQTAAERAKVSAPPGHSEHHTGYAVDLGDADAGGANLSESFENTRAFQWLEQNAGYYSFELSFPKGNAQGVSYEPWHWRFVGNQESLETFHKGRS